MSKKTTEKKPFYKRWWFILIVIIGVVGAFSGDDDEVEAEGPKVEDVAEADESEEEIEEEQTDDEEDIEDTIFGIGEPVEFEGQVVEVTNVDYSSGSDVGQPKDGKEYVIVHVSIENQSDTEISYNPFNFSMENSNGQVEDQTFTIIDSDTSLSSGELREGGNVEGTIAFEQPIDDGGLKLIFEPSFWSTGEVVFDLQQ